jgi:hypothetical protein
VEHIASVPRASLQNITGPNAILQLYCRNIIYPVCCVTCVTTVIQTAPVLMRGFDPVFRLEPVPLSGVRGTDLKLTNSGQAVEGGMCIDPQRFSLPEVPTSKFELGTELAAYLAADAQR